MKKDTNGDLIFSGQSSIVGYITLVFSLLFHMVYCFFNGDSMRTHTYTQLSLCRGFNIDYPQHSTRLKGLPEKLPKFLFVSAHHNFRMRGHVIIPPAFLTQYERVYTLTSIKFVKTFFDVSAIVNYLIGSIDLQKTPKEDHPFNLMENMQKSIAEGVSCAIIVYSTRSNSAFLGDKSMCMRKGIFAGSLSLQVPILDIITVEPTPNVQETTVDLQLYNPPYEKTQFFQDAKDYNIWRENNTKSIDAYAYSVQSSYLDRLDNTEQVTNIACSIHDELGTCHGIDAKDAQIAFKENESCKRSK